MHRERHCPSDARMVARVEMPDCGPLLVTGKRARLLFWRSAERTGEILHMRRETLPSGGWPDWTCHLLQDDQKQAGKERGALNLPRGPQVVAAQQQQQRVTAH